jgi:hypothetical protein
LISDLFNLDKLIPGPFREFLPFVSPSGLRVIHKEDVLKMALKSVRLSLDSAQYRSEVTKTSLLLTDFGLSKRIIIHEDLSQNPPLIWEKRSDDEKKMIGERILELYFFLVHSNAPLFLDLRNSHFSWNSAEQILYWRPSKIWHNCTSDFKEQIIALYKYFFKENTLKSGPGIPLYRWKSTPSEGYDDRISELLNKHFGSASNSLTLFSIQHFKDTFHLIFEEGIKSRSRFHPELTFLGTTLAGLYYTLEHAGTPLDVKSSYLRVVKPA